MMAKIAQAPSPVFQPLLQIVFNMLLRRHPALFERLGEHRTKVFAFLPAGAPCAVLVRPTAKSVKFANKATADAADVVVSGKLALLLALLEGRIDGDAMFFSRDLCVSGDMAAIVALRNAIDDSGVDLPQDLSPLAGPFANAFAAVGTRVRRSVLSKYGAQYWN